MEADRWPPSYDAEELQRTIRRLRVAPQVSDLFYDRNILGPLSQGDVIQLDSPLPVIGDNGRPATIDASSYWFVIGNTCDYVRTGPGAETTQIVPIVRVDADKVPEPERKNFLNYDLAKRFYLPPWSEDVASHIHFADFMRPVTVYKGAIENHSDILVSLNQHSWFLLNACLVRFLARDDGRFD